MRFFKILRKCTSFHWNCNYVSDGSYQYVKTILLHACGNGVQITWFRQWAQNKLLNFKFIFDLISNFRTGGIFCTLTGNLEGIVSILSAIYFETWSQSDFTDVNPDRAGGGILCKMLFIELHRRRGRRQILTWRMKTVPTLK